MFNVVSSQILIKPNPLLNLTERCDVNMKRTRCVLFVARIEVVGRRHARHAWQGRNSTSAAVHSSLFTFCCPRTHHYRRVITLKSRPLNLIHESKAETGKTTIMGWATPVDCRW